MTSKEEVTINYQPDLPFFAGLVLIFCACVSFFTFVTVAAIRHLDSSKTNACENFVNSVWQSQTNGEAYANNPRYRDELLSCSEPDKN